MGQNNINLYSFNRGLISQKALSRTDLERTALSSVINKNYIPEDLGSMTLRPGFGYVATTASSNLTFGIPFVFSTTDTSIIELTGTNMRIIDDDALVTRASVTATISNGTFDFNLSGWTDADESGGVSQWITGGYMELVGNDTGNAIRYQEITVIETGTAHALRIEISRGPVTLRIGSTAGDDDYVSETSLDTGSHSIVFTPTGNFFIQFQSFTIWSKQVNSVAIESSGTFTMTAPWAEADLSLIRYRQSGDIVFIACAGYKQRKIERRSNNSWSLVEYDVNDGPYLLANGGPIKIASDAITGDVTLTASKALFKSGHIDSIFSITSSGQAASVEVTAENTFSTTDFRVTGVGGQRSFAFVIIGTWVATVTLQYSVGDPGSWIDFSTYTTNQSINIDDGLNNQIIYWRVGVKTDDFTSGTVDCDMTYSGGLQTGVVRLRTVASAISATASVVVALGSTSGTSDWSEGAWSVLRGYPSSVTIYESRMTWAGKDNLWLSINDVYDGFDPEFEGDAQPISRSIGYGPVDTINWLEVGDWLVAGAEGAEHSIRSSGDREPLTRSNINIKASSTQGSASMAAVKIDNSILFVDKTGTEVYDLAYTLESNDARSRELSIHIPEIGEEGFTRMEVQRRPDTRVHLMRGDGTAVVLLFNKAEDILAFVEVETDGTIEDVIILPSLNEDRVYYSIKRTINSSTVRYWEKWALQSESSFQTFIYDEPKLQT